MAEIDKENKKNKGNDILSKAKKEYGDEAYNTLKEEIGKIINAKLLLNAVMQRERVSYPYKLNTTKYNNYIIALDAVREMSVNGILTFEADDPDENYTEHAIEIKWKLDGDLYFLENELKKIVTILSCTENLYIPIEKGNEWTLVSHLYIADNESGDKKGNTK